MGANRLAEQPRRRAEMTTPSDTSTGCSTQSLTECNGHEPDAAPLIAVAAWAGRASRSRLAPFLKAARTMGKRRGLIIPNVLKHRISNGRVEGRPSRSSAVLIPRAARHAC